jgi:hypothetical protein
MYLCTSHNINKPRALGIFRQLSHEDLCTRTVSSGYCCVWRDIYRSTQPDSWHKLPRLVVTFSKMSKKMVVWKFNFLSQSPGSNMTEDFWKGNCSKTSLIIYNSRSLNWFDYNYRIFAYGSVCLVSAF